MMIIRFPAFNGNIRSDQSLSHVRLFATPWIAARQASLSFTISWSLPKFMFLSWWCYYTISSSAALFFFCLQSFPGSGPFSNESALPIRWPKYWSFSFSISPSSEYSGLISFKIEWFDLLAVQRTLKSLLQQHSLKASVLWHSAFFMVQLSQPYVTTGKTIALTIQIFVGTLWTGPFRYDLNQIPYNYTVEVMNRFKGLDVLSRVPEELWTEFHNIVQEAVKRSHPIEK